LPQGLDGHFGDEVVAKIRSEPRSTRNPSGSAVGIPVRRPDFPFVVEYPTVEGHLEASDGASM
jgi:hypothetical protein